MVMKRERMRARETLRAGASHGVWPPNLQLS